MNSYPVELLVQHVPVMFVAGLNLPQHVRNPSETAPVGVNGHVVSDGREPSAQELRDPFTILAARLRNALGARRRSTIWDPDKSHRFNVLLVDKAQYRLSYMFLIN
jgi:trafficking protein particle complex subunit 11